MGTPKVSVVIPTYNSEDLLPRALDSIIAQTYDDWEIVLVDDGSSDGTPRVAADYKRSLGDRLISIRRKNGGCGAARNEGIEAARGSFVAFLDADDEFLPHKLERQMSLFERRPELGLVYCDYAFIDLEGVRHESAFDTQNQLAKAVPYEEIEPGLCVCTSDLFDILMRSYFIATIVGVVRREVLGCEIRFPEGSTYSEEWLFYLRIAKSCQAGFVNEALCLHHFVPLSVTRTSCHRNVVRSRRLLLAIRQSFPRLTNAQRLALRHNLSATCRQLGYEYFRRGRYGVAGSLFMESFSHQPSLTALANLTESAVRFGKSVRLRVEGSGPGESP